MCAWFVSWGGGSPPERLSLSSSRVPPSFRESLIRGGVLEAVPFLSPVLAVSCFGVSHVSPLWVRGSFLRGPPAFSRPFLLLPTVESLGFGSRASAAAVARVRPFVYTSPTARLPAHRVPYTTGALGRAADLPTYWGADSGRGELTYLPTPSVSFRCDVCRPKKYRTQAAPQPAVCESRLWTGER